MSQLLPRRRTLEWVKSIGHERKVCYLMEAKTMRSYDRNLAGRWRKIALEGSLVLLGLTASLPDGRAQMTYKGGLVPTRRERENPPRQQTAVPAVPPTIASFFPDNDFTYPSYYPGEGTQRPLPSSANLALYRIAPSILPWNRVGFEDYNEPLWIPRDSSLGQAKKYLLTATPLSLSPSAETPLAMFIAHLPEQAVLWAEGTRTRSTGRTRCFQSPPLLPGRQYNYQMSVAWIEDGRWVSQTRIVPVQAGLIQAIYLRPTP